MFHPDEVYRVRVPTAFEAAYPFHAPSSVTTRVVLRRVRAIASHAHHAFTVHAYDSSEDDTEDELQRLRRDIAALHRHIRLSSSSSSSSIIPSNIEKRSELTGEHSAVQHSNITLRHTHKHTALKDQARLNKEKAIRLRHIKISENRRKLTKIAGKKNALMNQVARIRAQLKKTEMMLNKVNIQQMGCTREIELMQEECDAILKIIKAEDSVRSVVHNPAGNKKHSSISIQPAAQASEIKLRVAVDKIFERFLRFMTCVSDGGIYQIYNTVSPSERSLTIESKNVPGKYELENDFLMNWRNTGPLAKICSSSLSAVKSVCTQKLFYELDMDIKACGLSFNVDPNVSFCIFDLSGSCKNPKCRFQHCKDIKRSSSELLQQVKSFLSGESVKNIDGFQSLKSAVLSDSMSSEILSSYEKDKYRGASITIDNVKTVDHAIEKSNEAEQEKAASTKSLDFTDCEGFIPIQKDDADEAHASSLESERYYTKDISKENLEIPNEDVWIKRVDSYGDLYSLKQESVSDVRKVLYESIQMFPHCEYLQVQYLNLLLLYAPSEEFHEAAEVALSLNRYSWQLWEFFIISRSEISDRIDSAKDALDFFSSNCMSKDWKSCNIYYSLSFTSFLLFQHVGADGANQFIQSWLNDLFSLDERGQNLQSAVSLMSKSDLVGIWILSFIFQFAIDLSYYSPSKHTNDPIFYLLEMSHLKKNLKSDQMHSIQTFFQNCISWLLRSNKQLNNGEGDSDLLSAACVMLDLWMQIDSRSLLPELSAKISELKMTSDFYASCTYGSAISGDSCGFYLEGISKFPESFQIWWSMVKYSIKMKNYNQVHRILNCFALFLDEGVLRLEIISDQDFPTDSEFIYGTLKRNVEASLDMNAENVDDNYVVLCLALVFFQCFNSGSIRQASEMIVALFQTIPTKVYAFKEILYLNFELFSSFDNSDLFSIFSTFAEIIASSTECVSISLCPPLYLGQNFGFFGSFNEALVKIIFTQEIGWNQQKIVLKNLCEILPTNLKMHFWYTFCIFLQQLFISLILGLFGIL
jgi:hypothetical protein